MNFVLDDYFISSELIFDFQTTNVPFMTCSLFSGPCCPVPTVPCPVQALLIRALLEYAQSSEVWLPYGLALVGGILLTELSRSWTMALVWAINYRTAARLRGAALSFAFKKILRLRSTKDISTGEVRKHPRLPSCTIECLCYILHA